MTNCNSNCASPAFIANCTFNASVSSESYPKDVDCAMSLQKRNLCLGAYGCRMGNTSDVAVPFICWKCVTSSPIVNKNELYGVYRSCMENTCSSGV